MKHPTYANPSVLVGVAALDKLDEIFDEVVVIRVLDIDFTLLEELPALEDVDMVVDFTVLVLSELED